MYVCMVIVNCFLKNLFNSIPSYFSHSLICPDTLLGDYNKVYIYKVRLLQNTFQKYHFAEATS